MLVVWSLYRAALTPGMIDFQRPIYRRLGPLVPYGACFIVVWGLIGLESDVRWGETGAALALQLIVGIALWWRERWEQHTLPRLAAIVLFLGSVALLRDGVGKTVGGYGTLLLLPVIWSALRDRRGELALAVAGAALVQLGPLLVIGGAYYPASGWRSGALMIVIAAVLGVTVLALVDRVLRSERLYRLLAENSSDLVLRGTSDGVILYASPASQPLLGYAPEELVGRTISELTHPEDLLEPADRARGIDAQGYAEPRLARMHHRDGRWLWLEATARPIRNGEGSVTEQQSAFRDVTERVQRDAEQQALAQIATLLAARIGPADGDPTRVLNAVGKELACLFDATAGAVVRFDPAEGQGTIVGAWTQDGHQILDHKFELDGPSAAARVYRTQAAARLDQYEADEGPVPMHRRISGAVGAPVTVSGELWGAVGVAFSDGPVPAGVEHRLARFADLVSLAISSAEMLEALAREASTDPLTALANRRVFHERLVEEVERARRYGHSLTVALFDVDHFKRVNDLHGHQVGDRVLIEVAQRIAAQSRAGELVARIGGEEFAWLMPQTDEASGRAAADRARRAVASPAVYDIGSLTLSAGVACISSDLDAEDLMQRADKALYGAKLAGRNRTVIYSKAVTPP